MNQQIFEDVLDLCDVTTEYIKGKQFAETSVFSLLQNTETLVERGIGLLKTILVLDPFTKVTQYLLHPNHQSYYYNFCTTDYRNEYHRSTTQNAPIINTSAKYSNTEVFTRVAKLAVDLGCKDEYTNLYPTLAIKRSGVVKEVPELMGMDLKYKVVQDGHYTTIMFLSPSTQIDLYTPEIYKDLFIIENNEVVGVNENIIIDIYLFKSSAKSYREWVKGQHKLDLILSTNSIPYFRWLREVLFELSQNRLHPWLTPKTWKWVEHLGFIHSHKSPLKTRHMKQITNYLEEN